MAVTAFFPLRALGRILWLCSALFSLQLQAAAAAFAFLPEQQVLPELSRLEQQAVAEQKQLLLVLGATWCHDSVALLEQFNQPALKAALQQRYLLAFVDVAYLEFGAATMTSYQQPLYYGTPTVLMIDPVSRQLLNKSTVMHWTNAAKLQLAEYQQYFLTDQVQRQYAKEQMQLAAIPAAVQQQIHDFEQQQAKALAQAYLQVGPLLKAYKESGKPASDEFKQRWDQLKAFRSNILPQVALLQQQAIKLAPGEILTLPAPVANF
ncbi:thioredoxin family protein [Rheinheimera sp. 4Y26]|uniref:thioredoxin family protein n=1 Tax=Rheinheimera sp. 4Y26 TaxID=2977811 RepID=UPI0021B1012E|nr:thioredoxin family protein [Rheinheimera sp. 4Y26]MCT6698358.1 thioredoxin family protein [Rheinheimera sp. 4Y26]